MARNVWRKSSRSGSNGQCVEVRDCESQIDVRDSKAREAGMLSFSASPWDAFVSGIKADGHRP
ncbi:DUF397 domain-containing protein [Micromonospora haikouensis]|uniref:DUF397 domain-containing protein n=1 Tax=Micromonospora haikouensis TaxID=686309 RepID=UPI0036CF0903